MSIKHILKRNGTKQKYQRQKITAAIWKSFLAVYKNKANRKEADRLSRIVENILIKSNGKRTWLVEEIQDVVEQVLLAAGRDKAAKAYILYRNQQSAVRKGTVPFRGTVPSASDNLNMSENALAAMAKRYLWKDAENKAVETPRQAIERVAAVVAENEKKKSYWCKRFLDVMSAWEFVPGGCYFRGAGNKQNGSLANCFVLPVEDSLEKIFDAVKWAALIHQMGGGTGFNFSRLRPRGDVVKSGGMASGPINFMKAFDAETQIVMQGGTHRGANMGILNVDHPDIFEFIRAKSIDGEVSNFNISVGISDSFMRAVKKNSDWSLINPHDQKIVKKIPARSLWEQIVNLAHATGDPGLVFLDTINNYNPLQSLNWRIDATNVCGEQPLFPFDVCNLGSVNLSKFVIRPFWQNPENPPSSSSVIPAKALRSRASQSRGAGIYARNDKDILKNINWDHLEFVVRIAVRFLDDGIDVSAYPIPQISDMAHKLRRVGLGVMGWADMLAQLGIPYNSDEGIKFAETIMKFIQDISWNESEKLAKEKAVFPLWKNSYFNGSKNLFGKKTKVRNIAVTTIAPTGTISMIADCSSGIEPYFALEYTKNVVAKDGLKYKNKYYQEASSVIPAKAGIYLNRSRIKSGMTLQMLKSVFITAHGIFPDWHVKMQAAFQKYTDNAVSKTINFSHSAAVKDIENAYLLAWKKGCKGITVYRDRSRSGQVLQTGKGLTLPQGQTLLGSKLSQSQLQITPLSQRAYQIERAEIAESASDGHCPECGAVLEITEGCSLCRNCGFSKCSI